jgi:hypothetical protein
MLKSSLFVKTYISLFIPYPSDKLIKDGDIRSEDTEKVLENIDFERL